MEKFSTLTAPFVPLPIKDVDTDMIIPAQFLTSISREGYGQNLFRRLRDSDSNFPLDREIFRGAKILVADSNFGCGSSREHAVWALLGAGIKAIIAPSFADIFAGNSAKNGLVLITLPQIVVSELLTQYADIAGTLTIDLEAQTVLLPSGATRNFEFDQFRKHCILNGHDDLDYILSHREKIEQFRAKHSKSLYFSAPGKATNRS